MPIVHGHGTMLYNRAVRVDRRRVRDDGAHGTIPSFATILDRYWVAIYPAQHQPRDREELGEVADQSHNAIGPPTRNGVTVMVGDRFIDEVNNNVFEVKGVERPRPGSPYAAGHRYTLRQLRDIVEQIQS
jgi:hypothetical protein